jgi:hypothetical protein
LKGFKKVENYIKLVQGQDIWRLTAPLEEREPADVQREMLREARENWLKVDRVLEERYT